jgi:hypothetical protein
MAKPSTFTHVLPVCAGTLPKGCLPPGLPYVEHESQARPGYWSVSGLDNLVFATFVETKRWVWCTSPTESLARASCRELWCDFEVVGRWARKVYRR